ncbi:uncharacterized protein LOC144120225 [Amblyomma americanum]
MFLSIFLISHRLPQPADAYKHVFFLFYRKIETSGDEETFSPCGKLVGSAVFAHILNVGFLSKALEAEVRPLIRRLQCGPLVRYLYSPVSDKWTGEDGRIRVVFGFARVLWYEALWVAMTAFGYFATLMFRVPLLEALLEDASAQPRKASAVLFLLACVADLCFSCCLEYAVLRFSTQVKALMEGALFTKDSPVFSVRRSQTTRMSARALSEFPVGHLVSLVGVDCHELFVAAIVCSQTATGLFCLPALLWMLSERTGAPPVAGCVILQLLLMAAFVPASLLQTGLWASSAILCAVLR